MSTLSPRTDDSNLRGGRQRLKPGIAVIDIAITCILAAALVFGLGIYEPRLRNQIKYTLSGIALEHAESTAAGKRLHVCPRTS